MESFITFLTTHFTLGAEQLSTANDDPATSFLSEIDSFIFRQINTNPKYENVDASATKLFIHARNIWVAGIKTVISGQPYAATPLLRTSLESACYATLIYSNAELARVWLDRHKDEQSAKNCRKLLTPAVALVAAELEKKAIGLGKIVTDIYQTCIDEGAHPNVRGVPGTAKGLYGPNGYRKEYVEMNDFYGLQSLKTRAAISNTAYVGLLICYIICLLVDDFGSEPFNELSKLSDRLDNFEL